MAKVQEYDDTNDCLLLILRVCGEGLILYALLILNMNFVLKKIRVEECNALPDYTKVHLCIRQ